MSGLYQIPDLRHDLHQSIQSIQLDASWANDSPYPPVRTPGPRMSHASAPSWTSASFMKPSHAGPSQVPLSRSLPHPISAAGTSMGMSAEGSQWRVSDADTEPPAELGAWATTEPSIEAMTVEPVSERDLESAVFTQQNQHGRTKGVVGSFMNGIRSLPRTLTKNPLRSTKKLPDEMFRASESVDPLPRYDDPGQPMAGPSNVQYVQAMEMPSEHPVSAEMAYPQEEQSADIALEDPHSTHLDNMDPPRAPALMPMVRTPVDVIPEHASDYKMMDPPLDYRPPGHDSLLSVFANIIDFLIALRDLPWTSSPVTVEYFPEDSVRAFKPEKKVGSWYTMPKRQDIDLISTPLSAKPEISHGEVQLVRSATPGMQSLRTSHGGSICESLYQRYSSGSVIRDGLPSPVSSGRNSRQVYVNKGKQPMYPLSPSSLGGSAQLAPGFGRPVDSETGEPIPVMMVVGNHPVIIQSPSRVSHAPTHIRFSALSKSASNIADTSMSR
ncbi:uncharacterized protein LAESUDRAFT_765124 [Laetiporus sulphureus 93-53]|uniref:Uncharacterized protein n=1 Tax=Laetiporus sulphureus 93-53 TaxID=1314785 RepID=A0A165AY51_9APHY|nr:uncharacterized protein LAESUDRAFT_765124 [Laetiporus sulphureus 93-53]KZS99878.1 hypothetical protein LAESUDRAFT_765124 [Laetiporus sulphureus 93-53]